MWHGGTNRHGTVNQPCHLVPCRLVPCQAVPVPCSAGPARLANYRPGSLSAASPQGLPLIIDPEKQACDCEAAPGPGLDQTPTTWVEAMAAAFPMIRRSSLSRKPGPCLVPGHIIISQKDECSHAVPWRQGAADPSIPWTAAAAPTHSSAARPLQPL